MKKASILVCALALVIASCNNDCDCGDPQIKNITQYELDKSTVEINTTNVSTGFESVFNELYTDSTSRAKLCQVFVNNARFYDDESGYFFIETLNDAWVVAHINHDIIGTSRINVQDENGTYFIKSMVETVTYAGYGFVEYFRKNPANDEIERKLSFVTSIKSADWFIGTGFYGDPPPAFYSEFEKDRAIIRIATKTMAVGIGGLMNGNLQGVDKVDFCRSFVDHIRFFDNSSGYFFINDFNGLNIAHGADKEREGENDYDVQDANGVYIVREMINIAKSGSGGYYQYQWKNPVSGNIESKYVYVQPIPNSEYFIASGFYVN